MDYKMLEDPPSVPETNEQKVRSDKVPNTMPKGEGKPNNDLPDIVWRQLFNNRYHLPFVKRSSGLILTANSLIKRYIIANFQTVLSNEILSSIPLFKTFKMKKREAEAFNVYSDKILMETHVFQPGEYLVNLASAKRLVKFLSACYDLIINRIKDNSLFGFIRINEKNEVPFIWNGDKKLVPLFYFDGQSEFLDARSNILVDPWKIWYIQFCCKLLKIRKEFHERCPIKVIDLDDLKTLLPADTSIELCCPEHINQDLLAPEVRVAALHNTTPCLSSKDSSEQTSVVGNEAIEMSETAMHTSDTTKRELKDASHSSNPSYLYYLNKYTIQAVKRQTQLKARRSAKKKKSIQVLSTNNVTPNQSAHERRANNKEVISQERGPQFNKVSSPLRRDNGHISTNKRLVQRHLNNITNSEQAKATPLCYEIRDIADLGQLQHHIGNEPMPMQICKNENYAVIENAKKTLQTELAKYLEHMRTANNKQKTNTILVEEVSDNGGVKRKMQDGPTNNSENQFESNHTDKNSLNSKLNIIQNHVERNNEISVTALNQIMAPNSRTTLLAQSTSPKNVARSTPGIQTNSQQQSVQTSSNPLVLEDVWSATPDFTITPIPYPVTSLNQNNCITTERLEPPPISITPQNTEAQNLPPRSTIKCDETNPPRKYRKDIATPGLPRASFHSKNQINKKRENPLAYAQQKMGAPSSMFIKKLEWFQQEFINTLYYEPSDHERRMFFRKDNYTVERKATNKQNTPRYKSVVSPDIKRNHIQQSKVDLDQTRLQMQQQLDRQYQELVYKQGFIDGRRQALQSACRDKQNN